MKKILILTAALVSAFTLSSCLGGDGDNSGLPSYQCAATVGSGAFSLYADNGSVLRPVTTVTGLDQLERAVIAFNLVPDDLNGVELESGKTYDVEIDPYYSYSIPTSDVINLYNDEVAADSLVKTQDAITQVQGFYGANGYINATVSMYYNQGTTPYLNVAYNSEEDIDVQNGKLNLTLYYDDKSDYASYPLSNSLFSFKLPLDVYSRMSESPLDKVTVVLNYNTSSSGGGQSVTCEMAKTDLYFNGF